MESALLENPVDELNANRTLADCGGHTLDARRARVTDAEHAGDARLHEVRTAG
jgi:hypothetical protein